MFDYLVPRPSDPAIDATQQSPSPKQPSRTSFALPRRHQAFSGTQGCLKDPLQHLDACMRGCNGCTSHNNLFLCFKPDPRTLDRTAAAAAAAGVLTEVPLLSVWTVTVHRNFLASPACPYQRSGAAPPLLE